MSLTLFWKRVVAPEIFEMRVPRDLSPFVLPSDFFNELTLPAFDILSPFVTNVCKPQSTSDNDQPLPTTKPTVSPPIPTAGPKARVALVTPSRDLPSDVTHPTVYLTTLHTEIPAVPTGPTLPPTAPDSQVPPATASPTYPPGTPNSNLLKGATSTLQLSKDELDIANFLATCTSESRISAFIGILPTDLAVIPWGGTTRHGIVLANTCPVDNWLVIFQALVKSGRIDLDDLAGAGNMIKTALSLIDRHEYGDAKLACLPTVPAVKKGVVDLYGNEADYLLKIIQPFLATAVTSCCSLPSCPSMVTTYTSYGVSLGTSIKGNPFNSSLQDWLNPRASQCQRRLTNKPSSDIPCHSDTALCADGTPSVSWHCSGVRTSLPRSCLSFKNFFVFSVDLPSRKTNLGISDLPQMITFHGKVLYLDSATLWNGNHYICIFTYENTWLIYDGLQESRQRNTGLSLFDTHPRGFLLSHVLYIV